MKRGLQLIFQILSILLFALILWWAGPEPWQQVVSGDWQAIFWAFFLQAAATIISAGRLKWMTESISTQTSHPYKQYYVINIFARALGIILPRSLSGIGGKAAGLKSLGLSIPLAIWIVLLDNIFDVFLLLTLLLPAGLYLSGFLGLTGLLLLSGGMIILLAGLIVLALVSGYSNKIVTALQRVPGINSKLKVLEKRFDVHLFPSPKKAILILGSTLLLNGCLILSYFYIGQAIGLGIGWVVFFLSFPFVQLSLIIAIAPGGLGIFDLGWLGLLQLSGLGEVEALSFVIAQRAYVTVFVLILSGVGLLITTIRSNRRHTVEP